VLRPLLLLPLLLLLLLLLLHARQRPLYPLAALHMAWRYAEL
jgi:hypothetical protein